MKLYCAQHDVQLQVTEPEIDNRGYDFSVVIGYTHLLLQNKSKISGGCRSWRIHAGVLKPDIYDVANFNLTVDGIWIGCDGATGGVLLHIIDAEALKANNLKVSYKYIDVFYIMAIACGLWADTKFSVVEALGLLRELQAGNADSRLDINEKFMLPITSSAIPLLLRLNVPNPLMNYVQGVSMAVKEREAGKPHDNIFREHWRRNMLSVVPESERGRFH